MSKSQQSEWRPIPGYPGFLASSDGRIWSEISKAEKKQTTSESGYPTIWVWDRGRDRRKRVHQLIALAFHGSPPSQKHTVDHINRNKADNRAENLRWACPITQGRNTSRCKNIYGRSHWSDWLGLPA